MNLKSVLDLQKALLQSDTIVAGQDVYSLASDNLTGIDLGNDIMSSGLGKLISGRACLSGVVKPSTDVALTCSSRRRRSGWACVQGPKARCAG